LEVSVSFDGEIVYMSSIVLSSINFDQTELLVKAAKNGDDRAFEQLIAIYRKRLVKVAIRIMRNTEDAEDAVQIASMKAFLKLPLFRGEASFYTWLCRITANECLSHIRSRKPWAGTISIDQESGETNAILELPDNRVDPERAYHSEQLSGHLHRAIGRLSANWQQVLRLRHFEEFSELEIACAMQVSRSWVKTTSYRARKRLRRHLTASTRQLTSNCVAG
jgi:RNA polymerase sigma-70 factor, ECF subfamily